MTVAADLDEKRAAVRAAYLADEAETVRERIAVAGLSADERCVISENAAALVRAVRSSAEPTLMEQFLNEYGLSTREGVALMCLAEALLRVPDAETIDALIEDKISSGRWSAHIGHSSSPLVNASTWALMLTGKVLSASDEEGLAPAVRAMVKRLGEPVVRQAVAQAMRELGRHFVLGRTIEEAKFRAAPLEERGHTHSYDMLGEAARSEADARRYHLAYSDAITALAPVSKSDDIAKNPGISVKLSALFSRYEYGQRDRVMNDLVARVRALAVIARSANMGFNIDAEEADRLDLSLDVIEAVLADPALAGWDGFGVVVQAYAQRAAPVIDWVHALASALDRRVMVRLVKGAYWDTEIKRAQVLGLAGFPVFTRKAATDVSYIACARKLVAMTDRLYPQFATHNAHTVSAILHLAPGPDRFEFQRLHGMGEALHHVVMRENGTRCRIYAPVGAHRDLLAYLVRRLLENGANSSFVHQIVDDTIAAETIARDPFDAVTTAASVANPAIVRPQDVFCPGRRNSRGFDLTDPVTVAAIEQARAPFRDHVWRAGPVVAGSTGGGDAATVRNPARPDDVVGEVVDATPSDVERAVTAAEAGFADWSARPAAERAGLIRRAADLYEANAPEFFALAAREAGKTLLDGVGEVREAADFARYYAGEAKRIGADRRPCGAIACISPWNFPLAIFSGQIFGSLAAGNVVVAKPAEQTPLIAAKAVSLMHEAGIPADAVQLVPGDGSVGAALTGNPRIAGVCFTGSTETAQSINRAMADNLAPDAPLIAETGGLNAMIVDSTALPEQAVRDIVASAFQSAGQRCSALRMLYVQEDVADRMIGLLQGAMAELRLGDPWDLSTDVGPVIEADAKADIEAWCDRLAAEGLLIARLRAPRDGHFVAPAAFRLDGIGALEREVFGPVLHVATYRESELDAVIDAINAKGYGLTFGLHTRIDDRVERIVDRIRVGNTYVNRNQIGAVVGSQPFGGEGLSGTGPKAGGPFYVRRLTRQQAPPRGQTASSEWVDAAALQRAIDALRPSAADIALEAAVRTVPLPLGERSAAQRPGDGDFRAPPPSPDAALRQAQGRATLSPEGRRSRRASGNRPADRPAAGNENLPLPLPGGDDLPSGVASLPGPTGESNRLTLNPRGIVICAGPDAESAVQQADLALAIGNAVVVAAPGVGDALDHRRNGFPVAVVEGAVPSKALETLTGFDAVASFADEDTLRGLRRALAARDGPLIPLITEADAPERLAVERHLCIDTTAAGGNASLLAAAGE